VRILIPEAMHADAVGLLRSAGHDVVHDPTLRHDRARLMDEAPLADAIIVRNRTEVRGELLRAMKGLRVVGRLGVGLDNIDLDACRARGIEVVPAIGGNSRTVAEYILTSALILLRGTALFGCTAGVAAGEWPRTHPDRGREIAGLAFGVVGYGSIGRTAAQIAQGLGMQVIAYARSGEQALRQGPPGVRLLTLDQVLAQADVVSVSLPITPETRDFIGERQIAAMKRGAVLVNTARGGVVNEHALVRALREGRLGGAAVDVFEREPLPAGSAFADPPPNLLLTPHIAGVSANSEFRVADIVARRVIDLLHAVRAG
jgi:(S)-sulfolactate dehydrogenase